MNWLFALPETYGAACLNCWKDSSLAFPVEPGGIISAGVRDVTEIDISPYLRLVEYPFGNEYVVDVPARVSKPPGKEEANSKRPAAVFTSLS